MAITFGTASTSGNTQMTGVSGVGPNTLTTPLPSGWAAGQFAILVIYLDSGSSTTPSGWTNIPGSPFGSANEHLYIFTRILQTGDSSPACSVTMTGSQHSGVGAIATYNGADILEAIGTYSDGRGPQQAAWDVTTLSDGAFAVYCVGLGNNYSSGTGYFNSSSTGVTKRFDTGTSAGNDSEVALYDKNIATRGATGTATSSSSSMGANEPWVAVTVVLRVNGVGIKVDSLVQSLTLGETLTAPVLSSLEINLPVLVEPLTFAEETPTVITTTLGSIHDEADQPILDEAGEEIRDESSFGAMVLEESLTLTEVAPVVSRTSFITGLVEPLTVTDLAPTVGLSEVIIEAEESLTFGESLTAPLIQTEPNIEMEQGLTLTELAPQVKVGTVLASVADSLTFGEEEPTVERTLAAGYITDESNDYILDEAGDPITDESLGIDILLVEELHLVESFTIDPNPNIELTESLAFFETLYNLYIPETTPSVDILLAEHLRLDDGSSYDEYYIHGGDRHRFFLTRSQPFNSLMVERGEAGNRVIDGIVEGLTFGEEVEIEVSSLKFSDLIENLSFGENLTVLPSGIKILSTESLTLGETLTKDISDLEVRLEETLKFDEQVLVIPGEAEGISISFLAENLSLGESVTVLPGDIAILSTESLTLSDLSPNVTRVEGPAETIVIDQSQDLKFGETGVEVTLGDIEITILESLRFGEFRYIERTGPGIVSTRRKSGLLTGVY